MQPRDRYRGCLLGLAAGDALGVPVEFLSRSQIQRSYGRLREMVGGGWLNVAPGEVTDDTQMAMAIAGSIARLGRVDPEDIARGFVAWFRSKPKDVGNTTSRSIRYLLDGVPWHEAGPRTHQEMGGRDAGNGSLMRTAPIALACRGDPERLVQASLDVSVITHGSPLATWSCVALGCALVAILGGEESPERIVEAASQVEEPRVRETVLAVLGLQRDEIDSGGYVLHTLQAALWSFVQHDDFEETVVEAINLGGDTDTTGAVAGALAGARYGAAAIPARWLDVLQHHDELTRLADQLLEVSGVT